jgi:hypothetical protein
MVSLPFNLLFAGLSRGFSKWFDNLFFIFFLFLCLAHFSLLSQTLFALYLVLFWSVIAHSNLDTGLTFSFTLLSVFFFQAIVDSLFLVLV